MRTPTLRSRLCRASIAAVTSAVIGGCGGPSTEAPSSSVASVASVPRTGASSTPTRTAAAVQRPLIRLDTTPEEMDRMYQAFDACLTEHGAPSKEQMVKTGDRSAYTKAATACADLEPDDYQDKLKREHPAEFKDKQRAQIACMRAHGLKIETSADGWGYLDPARDMGSAWDHKCEQKAFGG